MLLEGGAESKPRRKADGRDFSDRSRAACIYLNRIVEIIRRLNKREVTLRKMERWLDAHDESHEKYYERDRRYTALVLCAMDDVSNLADVSENLAEEIQTWPDADRKRFIAAWLIPWPCTFRATHLDTSLDSTPWREYCPF